MTASDSRDRANLKISLLHHIQQLSLEAALLPSSHPEIDAIVAQLEAASPHPHPLLGDHWPLLLGTWQLIYASRGTVVTRQLADSNPLGWLPVTLLQVWQTLRTAQNQLLTENGADLALPWLGTWRLKATGTWTPINVQTATVAFDAFALQARLAGTGWALPELRIPVWEQLRREALWTTSYLDDDLRVGRGATGNLFVFRRAQTP